MLILVLIFLVIFTLVVLAFSLGWRYLEAQRKKKVTEMLQTVSSGEVVSQTLVLHDPERTGAAGRLLARFNFARRLEERIQQAGLTWTVSNVVTQMAVLAVVGAVLGTRLPLPLPAGAGSLLMAFICGLLPYANVGRQRTKRLNAFETQLPEALDFLGRAMRAGHAFSISLEMLSEESPAPLGVEFRKVFNEQNLGLPVETALLNLTTRVPLLDVRFFVSAVLLQRETGGNLAEIMSKLAHIIRERFKLKGQVKAASAHGRITGSILTIMPVALMLGLLVIAPGYLEGMANDSDGQLLIAGAIVAQVVGHLVIRKIIRIKV
jgi:tight adherence protein B